MTCGGDYRTYAFATRRIHPLVRELEKSGIEIQVVSDRHESPRGRRTPAVHALALMRPATKPRDPDRPIQLAYE